MRHPGSTTVSNLALTRGRMSCTQDPPSMAETDLSKPLTDALQHGLQLVEQLQTPSPIQSARGDDESATIRDALGSDDTSPLGAPKVEAYTDKTTGIWFLDETDLQYEHLNERQALLTPGILHKCQHVSCTNVEEEGGKRFPNCAKCGARYCSREHQVADWKACHKRMCAYIKSVRDDVPLDTHDIVIKLLCQIRLHLGPFTLAHTDKQGRGFAFVQSPCTLEDLASPLPVSCSGRKLERSLLVHFMTMGEYVDVMLQDDFELAHCRPSLQSAISSYDSETHFLVLLRLRCGYVAVVRQPLVPEAGAARRLAKDYDWAEHSSLQMNLDE